MKSFITKIIRFLKAAKHYYKYGGITQVEVSQVNYGEIFNGKTILITGGSQGIGLEMARRFLANGASVIITGRNQDKLDAIVTQIKNPNLRGIAWDISDVGNIDLNISRLKSNIDVVINNAGIYAKTQFPNCTSEDWDRVYDTNAKGTFFLCQAFCKLWQQEKSANYHKIINICSQGGFSLANNPYRMTKWDIRGFTKYLGAEMSRNGIIVNGIAPGLIMTDMQPEFKKQGENYYTEQNPLHRIGKVEEIAELAVFLASDAANFIVGQTICCDGGYTAS